jgi:hypothetical protein
MPKHKPMGQKWELILYDIHQSGEWPQSADFMGIPMSGH